MTAKRLIGLLLLVFAIGSVAYTVIQERVRSRTTSTPEAADFGPSNVSPFVIVYFFDSDKECATCSQLEAYALEAVQTGFASELASGSLQWRVVNIDEPQNAHYITGYGLYTKSVVVVRIENGQQVRWTNLEDVWELVYDKPAYQEYIRTNVRDFLEVTR